VFVIGQTYSRRELHRTYGGQGQGGISTPVGHNLILLFTGEQGVRYGYEDGWTAQGIFMYTGEGQVGNMTFKRGNRAVRDHEVDGKDLHLFQHTKRGRVTYVSQMVCTGFHDRHAPDREGSIRRVIVFELTPLGVFDTAAATDDNQDVELSLEPLSFLRQRALATTIVATEPSERKRFCLQRSSAVRVYVLRRADGICEGCHEAAPFQTTSGRPYLEPHHLRRLSDGGPDHPRWVAALCPNCHSRTHYGADGAQFNERIGRLIGELSLSTADS